MKTLLCDLSWYCYKLSEWNHNVGHCSYKIIIICDYSENKQNMLDKQNISLDLILQMLYLFLKMLIHCQINPDF